MKWVVDDTDNLDTLVDYLNVNRISFTHISIWNPSLNHGQGANQLPNVSDCILAINFKKFFDLIKHNQVELLEFINHNHIWVWSDMDGCYPLKDLSYRDQLIEIDAVAPAGKIYYFVDGTPTAKNWMWDLKNIKIKIYPYNTMVGRSTMRVTGGIIYKNPTAKDFLLTTVLKPIAPHRQILKDKIEQKDDLCGKGTVKFHPNIKSLFDGNYLGEYNNHIAFPTEVPSMDLYQNHFIEIVPETFFNNCHCITEKTLRPIMAKTPFITVAPAGQLEYFRSLGFKTFSHAINESYDQETDLEKRIDLIINSLEQIINKSSQNVYNDCQDVLEHNHRHLMMLAGGWKYQIDLFITQTLAEISG